MKPDRNLDHKQIGLILGVGGGSLRFVNAEEMQQLLGVKQGSVTPLGIINDSENVVSVIIEKALIESDLKLGVHPLTCEATTLINPKELIKFLRACGHDAKIIDFDDISTHISPLPSKIKDTKSNKINNATENKVDERGLSCTRSDNFARWYSEVVTKGEMIEYYDISGCYILRPNSCFIQKEIQRYFDNNMREMGIEDAYFPMFISKKALEAEAKHIDGFKPEVAQVTKSGEHDLNIPIAIRPTSETVMYPIYARWIHSHRDLPIRLNQQANIVRQEFKNPTPFIRTREFLWQEGHSAFATKKEADKEVLDILNLYARVYEDLLAVPVIKGIKTETEKFPGGDYTTTVETFITNTGRAIQGGTSHGLGQNFGKIFNISFEDENKRKQIPFQNSQGLTTRTIGVMIMQHGDDKGLVIPPRVSRYQVVIIPIVMKFSETERIKFVSMFEEMSKLLNRAGIRTHIDDRSIYNPGWKYNHQEMRGVPIRIEFGPKDMKSDQCILVRRDTGNKEKCSIDNLIIRTKELLETIQSDMYSRAVENMNSRKRVARTWNEFEVALNDRCFILSPSCNRSECEEDIKKRTNTADNVCGNSANMEINDDNNDAEEGYQALTGSAKTLCIPFDQPALENNTTCIGCEQTAKKWILFGRSY